MLYRPLKQNIAYSTLREHLLRRLEAGGNQGEIPAYCFGAFYAILSFSDFLAWQFGHE
jgi:hypothetical protein